MEITNRKTLLKGFFNVESITIQDNGSEYDRMFVDKMAGCGMLLYNTENLSIVLVKQFRAPLVNNPNKEEQFVLEIPAGILSPNEDPAVCIKREVEEETGYYVQDIEHIYTFYASPGYTNEELHLYYGTVNHTHKLTPGGGLQEEHESIQILEYPIDTILQMLSNKQIRDAKTLIALEWFLRVKV